MTSIHGLLYSKPLVSPETPADHAHPHPHPMLHVQQLASSPSLACLCGGSGAGSCSVCSLLPAPLVLASCLHCSRKGSALGSGEGSPLGSDGGLAVGSGEGSVLGFREGSGMGFIEGSALGSGEGLGVASVEGPQLGFGEGSRVGPNSMISPSPQLADSDDTIYKLCHLNRDQLRILWHQRLGHLHSRHVTDLHKLAQGVPSVLIATELDFCSVCAGAKLHYADHSATDS